MRLIDWIVLLGFIAVGITGLIGVLRSPLTFREAWTPLPWWLKAPIALVGLAGPLVLLQVVSWGFFTLLGAVTLIALLTWAQEPTPAKPLGKYGQMHLESLNENRPDVYREFQRKGQLQRHVQAIDQDAKAMKAQVVKDLAQKNPYNPVEWKNSRGAWEGWLDRTAEEFVLNDLVLVRDLETEEAMRDGYTD